MTHHRTIIFCKACRKTVYESGHVCPPAWLIRYDYDSEEEWIEYRAYNAVEAAEAAGEDYDADDYPLSKGGEIDIFVRKPDQNPSEAECFRVSGEVVMHYYASLKKADK